LKEGVLTQDQQITTLNFVQETAVPQLDFEAFALFPQAPALEPGLALFALLSASGAPILLTDSRDTALANAWAHDLETVSLN
jgi:hypothetical protein